MTLDTADLATRLRQTRADMLGTADEDHYWDCHEAAGEIERLRRWGRLTDAERQAVERAADLIDNKTCGDPATLRGLLERLSGTGDCPAPANAAKPACRETGGL
jgi:hypothetical protein